MSMRAPYSILIALAVIGTTLPVSGSPFWQRHSTTPPTAQQMAQPTKPATNGLVAQSVVANPGAVPQPAGKRIQLHLAGPGPHKGDWLRQYYTLPPSQQEQKLQQDPSFRSLSPDKQQHLLDRLRKFNSLSPDKQAKILNRMEAFEHLPPEKQNETRSLFHQYQTLPPDQKSQVSEAYHRMRQMSPEQRSQYMNSDEFRNSFSDEQRDLLRGMSELHPGTAR
jgi:hypothetical protein